MMATSLLTTITPATVTALTDLHSVQLELGLTGVAEAPYLKGQIAQASAAIVSWCGRAFAQETVREVWRPEGCLQSLSLARFPVTNIASVVEDGTTLASTDYEVDAESGLLWRLSSDERTTWRARKITVQYTGGYILPDAANRTLPHDVQRACILMVTAAWLAKGRDPMLRSESAQDVGQVSYLDPRAGMESMPPQAAALLQPYRVFTV
jgi:hypothetical protein